MNYKITLAYDGTGYSGWQLQLDKVTLQGALSDALAKIEGGEVTVHAAGRTDAGVHALGQVVSFKLNNVRHPRELLKALNGNLPRDIRVLSAESVDDSFQARVYSKGKLYRYSIFNDKVMNPLLNRYSHHFPYKLDINIFSESAKVLIGTHDFSMFTVSDCHVKSYIRTITDIEIKKDGPLIEVYFSGNGFLRYQIRTMTGALLLAATGRLPTKDMATLMKMADRKHSGKPAPAKGLTLMKVEY